MLVVEEKMLDQGLSAAELELVLRLLNVPVDLLPDEWGMSRTGKYELDLSLLSEQATKRKEGVTGETALPYEFLELAANSSYEMNYQVSRNVNKWTPDIVRDYPLGVDQDKFSKGRCERRDARVNEDFGGRNDFLKSVFPMLSHDVLSPNYQEGADENSEEIIAEQIKALTEHRLVMVIPFKQEEPVLDGTWLHFSCDTDQMTDLGAAKFIAAAQLLGIGENYLTNLLLRLDLFSNYKKELLFKSDSLLIDESLRETIGRQLGLVTETDSHMYFRMASKPKMVATKLHRYYKAIKAKAVEDIQGARDALMQISGRGSGVILSFDKLVTGNPELDSSTIIMPQDLAPLALNSIREPTSKKNVERDANNKSYRSTRFKQLGISAFVENIDGAEVLHVIEL